MKFFKPLAYGNILETTINRKIGPRGQCLIFNIGKKCVRDIQDFCPTIIMNLSQVSIGDVGGIRFVINLDSEGCI
jgi:hypothetical protein